jgi:hypothetical protein
MQAEAVLAPSEVDDHVDGRHEDDEVAERDDLLRDGQGDDVGEHDENVVGFFEVASAGELDAVFGATFDDAGVHERLGSHGHALVQHDRDDVAEQADGHDAHTGEMQVDDREPREQHEREQHQCGRSVTVEP